MEGIWAVARARVRRRWFGLVAIGVLAGVVGGLSTGAVAGERRTVTVAPRRIEATRAHDAIVLVNEPCEGLEPSGDAPREESDDGEEETPTEVARRSIDAQPGVQAVWELASFIGRTSGTKDWYYPLAGVERDPEIYRPIVAEGRLADPAALDEVMVSAQTAANTDLRVGSVIHMDFYGRDQCVPMLEGAEVRPHGATDVRLRVVGLLRDAFDIAPGATDRFMLATPAFARRWGPSVVRQPGLAVKLEDGTDGTERFVAGFYDGLSNRALARMRTNAEAMENNESADRVARASLLLLAAAIALLGLFAVGQAIRRHLTLDEAESETLEALGFTRRDRVVSTTIPGVAAAFVAAGVCIGVAYAMSPMFPLGRPRRLEPDPGFRFNTTAMCVGAVLVAAAVIGVFAASAAAARPVRRPVGRRTLRGLGILTSNAPPSAILGTRLALEPAGRGSVIGARSAVVGAAVGVAGMVAALTFAGSVHALLSDHERWGADFDLSVEVPSDALAERGGAAGQGEVQEGVSARSEALAADDRIEAVAVQGSAPVLIDGELTSAVSMRNVEGRIDPVVRSGRRPVGLDEIALGPVLARRLGKDVGDRVEVSGRSMVVVGTVLHASAVTEDYADSSLMSYDSLRELAKTPEDGYYEVIVARYDDHADADATTRDLDRRYPYGIMDESTPEVPPALRNIQDVQAVPLMLATFFGGLVLVALGNGLVVAGRRHRRQFGIVRSLGFTSGQVRATMTSMGVTLAAVALAVGIPAGLGAGGWLWTSLSRQLDVTSSIAWPLAAIAVAIPAVLAVAILAAMWPARAANSESAASVLRSE